jgi:hypothetical protein
MKNMTTIQSSFSNQGQICLCGSRILIEQSVYEKFKTAFVERTKKLTVGDPLDESSNQGAIVSKLHFDKIMHCIDIAKKEGGTISSTVPGRLKKDILLNQPSSKTLVPIVRQTGKKFLARWLPYNHSQQLKKHWHWQMQLPTDWHPPSGHRIFQKQTWLHLKYKVALYG